MSHVSHLANNVLDCINVKIMTMLETGNNMQPQCSCDALRLHITYTKGADNVFQITKETACFEQNPPTP